MNQLPVPYFYPSLEVTCMSPPAATTSSSTASLDKALFPPYFLSEFREYVLPVGIYAFGQRNGKGGTKSERPLDLCAAAAAAGHVTWKSAAEVCSMGGQQVSEQHTLSHQPLHHSSGKHSLWLTQMVINSITKFP